jgi:PRTRC genetic system ThiF family protein
MITFDPSVFLQTITIVGIGGTGAQIARSVARMVYDMKQARLQTPKIVLIDPDTVQPKNIGRQLFTAGDIGQPKAHVMMRRLNMALGLDITAIAEPVSKANANDSSWNTLVIGAVDNHLARREIAKVSRLWIDAGNHKSAGQVIIGNTGDRAAALHQIKQNQEVYKYLPNAALLFPGLLDPEAPTPEPAPDASCADLVAMREQDLLINDWMAVVTSQYVYKLLHRQPINSFITYISADAMAVRSVPISKENLEAYLQPTEEKVG